MSKKKLVIVGGGFGGLNLAKSLKNTDFEILLIDKKNHHLFQPLLYQVASAALSAADIAVPLRELFKDYSNVTVIMGEVVNINKEANLLTLSNGDEVSFDYLVLAVGASHSYFGHNEWEALAPGLKTINDAIKIREQILISFEKAERLHGSPESDGYLNFAIIGGGPTGVEMAGAIAEIAYETLFKNFRRINPKKSKIFLIEAAPRILPPYPESLSKRAKLDLEKLGVQVLVNTPVTDITPDGVVVQGGFIEAKNIIWAAGNQASPLLKTLNTPLDRQQRAIVEPDLSIPGYPHIFVIGDAAHVKDKKGNLLPGVGPVAIQQASYLGKILKKYLVGKRPPFAYFDKGSLATIGKAKAVATIGKFKFGGFFAWFIWCFIHIVYLIGFRNRFSVMFQWCCQYIFGLRGARLINRSIDDELKKNPNHSEPNPRSN